MKPNDGDVRSKEVSSPPGRGPSPANRADADARLRTLVERARTRDEGAFRELVVLHQDRAYGLALRITRSPADAEEVAQDAFVRAWLALPGFRGDSSFATWLHRIVARRALDRLAELKARGAREMGVEEAALLPAPHAGARSLEETARARRIERLVLALPAAQRAAVTLYYYEDMPVTQIAELLEMPENTVKTHLSRARSTLRTALARGDA